MADFIKRPIFDFSGIEIDPMRDLRAGLNRAFGITGQCQWKGKTIWEDDPPLDYQLYRGWVSLSGWFPGDDLPRVIPSQLGLVIEIVQDPDTKALHGLLPDGRRIVGIHPTQGSDPAQLPDSSSAPSSQLPPEKCAPLTEWMIQWADGAPHKRDDFIAAARKLADATRDQAREAYKGVPKELKLARGNRSP
jgi:hypothetical protein